MVFVAFALVGSNFSPPEEGEAHGAAEPKEGRNIQHLVSILYLKAAYRTN